MALKRWAWSGAPVVAALLAMVALLPPGAPTDASSLIAVITGAGAYRYGAERTGEHSQFGDDIRAARQNQERFLRRAGHVDSIVAASRGAHAIRSEDGLVTVVYERPLAPDSARFWLKAVSRELALYPRPSRRGLPLVVALLSNPDRIRPGQSSIAYQWGVQEYPDQATSAGACVTTVSLLARETFNRAAVGHDAAGNPVSRLLGACALYARFGAPGPRVSDWAQAGLDWWNPFTSQLLEARRGVRRYVLPRSADWGDNLWYGEVLWLEVGCLRGTAALCSRAVGLGREAEPRFPYYFSSQPLRGRVLAHLLATGTPEQFAAFWQSPLRPDAALAAAYGAPPGTLAHAALSHWFTAPAADSRLGNARATAAGLVWIGLALAVAVAAGRRWKAEP